MELSAEQQKQLAEQKQHCPFCKIVRGEIPSQKVYEDKRVLAILDINPLKEGHVLVLPKEHYPIMAIMPPEEFEHLFNLLPQMTKQLKQAMLTKHVTTFIANGAAAGQQAGHFMTHLIPSDQPIKNFNPPLEEQEDKGYEELQRVLSNNLPIMMSKNAQEFPLQETTPTNQEAQGDDRSQRLAELLEENAQFKQLLINNPEAVIAGLEDNPSLKPLFEGVDVHKLSKQLQAQQEATPSTPQEPVQPEPTEQPPTQQEHPETPNATNLTEAQLQAYLNDNQKLLHYLQTDLQTLKQAIKQQPKLQAFFKNTTPEEVLARIQQPTNSSLEDLAGSNQ